jgi:hypothetical protein
MPPNGRFATLSREIHMGIDMGQKSLIMSQETYYT